MKTKYINTGIIGFLILLFVSGCADFEEINTNPNKTIEVNASMVCTYSILSVTKFSGTDGKVMVSSNALPKYVGYADEAQLSSQYNLLGSNSFGGMKVLPNIEKMLDYADGIPAENSYNGVAKFLRAYLFYKLTMQMGDIPYTNAGLGESDVFKPKYDAQEDVLVGILDELEEAAQFFENGLSEPFDGDPTPYNGDPEKWLRATNALALRILMTLSNKSDVTSLNVQGRFNQIVNSGYLLEGTTGFLGLAYTSENKHPLSGTNSIFTSRTLISSLLMDNLKNLNDRRMYYYAEPAGAQITAGLTEDDPDAYAGVDITMDYAEMSANHRAGEYSPLNLRYLEEDACEPRMLITYAEQQLILAEAVIKDWITGSAQTYYEQGVTAALSAFLGYNAGYAHTMPIDQAYIDGYFTGEAAFKATDQEQLEQIWMQRYILNFMQDPLTTYFEYRRTGYPDFPVDPATSLNENQKDAIPVRWLYPNSETTHNRENLIEALNRQFGSDYDEINQLMWVLK